MTELKPCPFCGGEAEVIKSGFYSKVFCVRCCAAVGGDTKAEAIKAWNNRIEPKTPGGAIVPFGNARLKGGK